MTSPDPGTPTTESSTPAPSLPAETTSASPTTVTTTPVTTTPSATTAAPTTTPDPDRPEDAAGAALFDAVATEHGVIYAYGLVSAHSTPGVNDIVADAMTAHREQREEGIARLTALGLTPPLPAAGYQIPLPVDTPTDAATLAVQLESDSAVAWRAVLEQATTAEDRTFAVAALTQAAVTAAKWRQVLGTSPTTVAFPGGSE